MFHMLSNTHKFTQKLSWADMHKHTCMHSSTHTHTHTHTHTLKHRHANKPNETCVYGCTNLHHNTHIYAHRSSYLSFEVRNFLFILFDFALQARNFGLWLLFGCECMFQLGVHLTHWHFWILKLGFLRQTACKHTDSRYEPMYFSGIGVGFSLSLSPSLSLSHTHTHTHTHAHTHRVINHHYYLASLKQPYLSHYHLRSSHLKLKKLFKKKVASGN